jgi:DNA polymerase-1
MGRKRYLKDINSSNATVRSFAERNAINAPIQGSAADLIKIAMINIQKKIEQKSLGSKMILQVHDELIFDTIVEELDELKEIVANEMCQAITTKVPLVVELGEGSNWLQAH